MPKRSELELTKRAVDTLYVEDKDASTIVVIGIRSVKYVGDCRFNHLHVSHVMDEHAPTNDCSEVFAV